MRLGLLLCTTLTEMMAQIPLPDSCRAAMAIFTARPQVVGQLMLAQYSKLRPLAYSLRSTILISAMGQTSQPHLCKLVTVTSTARLVPVEQVIWARYS